MTRALPLPSLDEPEPGTCCPECRRPVRLAFPVFCPSCDEAAWQVRRAEIRADYEAAIRAKHEEARKRARTWQLGRAVS